MDRGLIKVDPEVDQIITKAYLKDEKHLRTIFLMSLTDLNKKRVFSRRFTTKEINDYVENVLLQIRKRRPIRELPMLDRFGPSYGAGYVSRQMEESDAAVCYPSDVDLEADSGGVCYPSDVETEADTGSDSGSNAASTVEVAAEATAAGVTEVIALATVALPVFVFGFSEEVFHGMAGWLSFGRSEFEGNRHNEQIGFVCERPRPVRTKS